MTDFQPQASQRERRQVAALCWRRGQAGDVEVLLVTSRDTGRWVIPKGGLMAGLSDPQAAAEEALEEAGVTGRVTPAPLGVYRYLKRLKRRAARLTTVQVYALAVEDQHDAWKEMDQRLRRWFPQVQAAAAVEEVDLKSLILAFDPSALDQGAATLGGQA